MWSIPVTAHKLRKPIIIVVKDLESLKRGNFEQGQGISKPDRARIAIYTGTLRIQFILDIASRKYHHDMKSHCFRGIKCFRCYYPLHFATSYMLSLISLPHLLSLLRVDVDRTNAKEGISTGIFQILLVFASLFLNNSFGSRTRVSILIVGKFLCETFLKSWNLIFLT